MQTERYGDGKRLLRYGYRVYSQNDEDGILAEIFRRIGTDTKTFIEFGVGDGSECNTVNLLVAGWKGLWLESDASRVGKIRRAYGDALGNSRLVLSHAKLTAENINAILSDGYKENELDLLSIDVDGNDYWLWKSLSCFRPRVVVVEYNALWRPPLSVAMRYRPQHAWALESHWGASLGALEKLGKDKGYNLVGCCLSGVNAFFVRQDLCSDRFSEPFTAENHYEPPRSWLGGYPAIPLEGVANVELV